MDLHQSCTAIVQAFYLIFFSCIGICQPNILAAASTSLPHQHHSNFECVCLEIPHNCLSPVWGSYGPFSCGQALSLHKQLPCGLMHLAVALWENAMYLARCWFCVGGDLDLATSAALDWPACWLCLCREYAFDAADEGAGRGSDFKRLRNSARS